MSQNLHNDGLKSDFRVIIQEVMGLFRKKQVDPKEVEGLTGLRPLKDEVFLHLCEEALVGRVLVYFAAVPFALIDPFDHKYEPSKRPVGAAAIEECMEAWIKGQMRYSWVCQRGNQFILSDDYIIYHAALRGQPEFLPCWVLGKPEHPDVRDVRGPIAPDKVSGLFFEA